MIVIICKDKQCKIPNLKYHKKEVQIARMILLNYHPDISRGQDDVLALMFDMNDLWEQYAALQIRRHLRDRFTVAAQKSKVFWVSDQRKKGLRPDLGAVGPPR